MPNPSGTLTAGDLETLAAHHVVLHRDYAADIATLCGTGFVPLSRNLPPQPFRLPFDWSANPLRDNNWMSQLHSWRMLDPHFNRLLAEPDRPEAFADIFAVVADWHRGNVRGRPGRFAWLDRSTGLRALKLALLGRTAERRGHGFADPGLIADLVDRHIAELSRPETLSQTNHGLMQLTGLAALLDQHPAHPGAGAARAWAVERMAALIDSQLGPLGIHTENSPSYHFLATKEIAGILAAPWWQLDAMAPLREKLAAAKSARDWLVDPAGLCVPVGDSDASFKRAQTFEGLGGWPHRRAGDTVGATLDGYGVVRTDPAVPAERSAMVFLTASFHSTAHKHADCLSLIWQEGGENLLIDSGKYGYQRDAMRDYFHSRRAHNTVEVDDWSFSLRAAPPHGSGMRRVEPLERTWLIEAEAPHDHEAVLHRRLVLFRPHGFLLAVDHLAGGPAGARLGRLRRMLPRRRTVTAWWHFNPGHAVEAVPDPDGRHLVSGLADGRRLFVSHVDSGAGPRAELHRGALEPRIQGWVSRAYLKSEPAPALGFSARSAGDFAAATLFELAGPGAPPRLGLRRDPAGRIALIDGQGQGQGGRSFAVGACALDIPLALL